MSVFKLTRWSIDRLYVFPYYQTREAYQAAVGVEPPPFDASRPPKAWFDPNAKATGKRFVVYDRVVAYSQSGSPIVSESNQPVTEQLLLPVDEAATVNIPPKGPTVANIKGADVPEVPCPLRPLNADEEIFFSFPGVVSVRLKGEPQPAKDGSFTEDDRMILMAIARKVGIAA